MTASARQPRLAFVSAPGGSIFMEEILAAVSDAVASTGVQTLCHRGFIAEVAQPDTRFVIVPHEYFALAPSEPPELYAATIGFGVEHPGTETFAAALAGSRKLGARFEISNDAVAEVRRQGLTAERFELGYVPAWDRQPTEAVTRPIDVAYLGTADERRVGVLADLAEELAELNCELLIPPHEPMTKQRPDFLPSEAKWDLLARSKVLINLHREGKTGFEWVRFLDAAINGCVVVTEPSTDLGPLVPGQHLLVAEPDRIAAVARAVALNEPLRTQVADAAYRLCRSELDMARSARNLARVAATLPAPQATATHDSAGTPRRPVTDDPPMAIWIPQLAELPTPGITHDRELAGELCELADLRSARARISVTRPDAPPARTLVDVICVRQPGDGPLGRTLAGLRGNSETAATHIAESPAGCPSTLGPDCSVTTHVTADYPLARGRARNLLLEHSQAELVCVIDSGDVLLGPTLSRLVDAMTADPGLDIAFAMATLGPGRMVNVLIPEVRRLRTRAYLSRGFVVRRSWLDKVGGFTEDPLLEGLVDHVFWHRSAELGASARLLRNIGFALWPRVTRRGPAELDPSAARQALLAATSDATSPVASRWPDVVRPAAVRRAWG